MHLILFPFNHFVIQIRKSLKESRNQKIRRINFRKQLMNLIGDPKFKYFNKYYLPQQNIMLLTKPFVTQEVSKAQLLNQQYNRLKAQSSLFALSPQYWMGYISTYMSAKHYTQAQLKELYITLQTMLELCGMNQIKQDNIYEIIICGVTTCIDSSYADRQQGIDLLKLSKIIPEYVNQVAQNSRFLKNKFFTSRPEPKKQINLRNQMKQEQIPQKIEIKKTNTAKKPKKLQHYQINNVKYFYEVEEQDEPNPQSEMNEQMFYNKFPYRKHEEDIMIPTNRIKKQNKFECPICLEEVTEANICKVSCGHSLHKNCFIEHFKSRVETKKFPITCTQEGCEKEVELKDFQQHIPRELVQKYYEFSLQEYVERNNKDTSWCPTAGCQAVFEYQQNLDEYRCPSCRRSYCLKCKSDSHYGKCEVVMSREDKEFVKVAEGFKMKQCPNCKFWVEKNKGCDHMTCRCGFQFCFLCGAKHGQCACTPIFAINQREEVIRMRPILAPRNPVINRTTQRNTNSNNRNQNNRNNRNTQNSQNNQRQPQNFLGNLALMYALLNNLQQE